MSFMLLSCIMLNGIIRVKGNVLLFPAAKQAVDRVDGPVHGELPVPTNILIRSHYSEIGPRNVEISKKGESKNRG
jgi:hypothetical protein